MKPLDRKSTSHGRSRSRLRTLMRGRLGWLAGVPATSQSGLLWLPLNQGGAEPATIVVDGQLLSRSERCIKRLLADHRLALGREVGDIVAWQQRTEHALSLIQQLAKGRISTESNPLLMAECFDGRSHAYAKRLIRHQPELASLLRHLGWYSLAAAEMPLATLKVLERHSEALLRVEKIHPLLAFRALLLLNRQEHNAAGLLTLLGSDSLRFYQPQQYELRELKAQIKNRKLPCKGWGLTSAEGITAAMEFAWWLQRRDNKTLKQATRLLNSLRLESVVNDWLQWKQQLQILVQRTQRAVKAEGWKKDEALFELLNEQAEQVAGKAPPWCDLEAIMRAVQIVSANSSVANPTQRVLEVWQVRLVSPSSAAAWLSALPRLLEGESRITPSWLRQLARISKQAEGPAIQPWQKVHQLHYWNLPDREIAEHCRKPEQQQLLGDTLLALEVQGAAASKPAEVELLAELLPISDASNNGEQLRARFTAFQQAESSAEHHEDRHLKLAHQLELATTESGKADTQQRTAQRASDFLSNVQLCRDFTAQNEWVDGLDDLIQLWANLLPQPLVAELLRGSAPPLLKQCARELHFLQLDKQTISRQLRDPLQLDVTEPGLNNNEVDINSLAATKLHASKLPRWIDDYPIELRPLLQQLAVLDSSASRSAGKLLARDFPRPDDLRAEITVLKKRLRESQLGPLSKRLSSLQQRLAEPVPVSAKRLARLQQKLAHLVLSRRIDEFAADVHRQFLPRWANFFGFNDANSLPNWLVDPKHVRNLLYIRQLQSPSRKLGQRVVQRRCQSMESAPWDFRDEPANRRFLHLLEQQGLHITPWLEGIGSVSYNAKAGNEAKLTEVRLSLCDDPLQILRMGAHFHTCLSPGGMNFFSVMANIADINKRVLYAHIGENKIVGRVLLALTDQGGLVSFHRYHHHGDWGFEEMVVDFCRQLAAAMGSVILDDGDVSCLVAHDWYDDGSEDLGGQFEALQAGSSFRKSLAELSPQQFSCDADAAFGEIGLTDLTIPQLLMLPELKTNPSLAIPAAELLARCQFPQLEVLHNVFQMAKKAEQGEAAWQLLREAIVNNCQRWIRREKWLPGKYIGTVVDFEPTAGLKLLRSSRDKEVRCWADDSPDRRKLVAHAFRKLGRHRQAELLLQK